MKNKKNKGDATHSIALGTAIIIIALVIIFGGVFYWMWSVDMLFLPSFVEDMLGIGKDDEPTWDLGALSELVKEGKNESGENVTLDISYENLRKAFLTENSEQGIYLTARVKYYSGNEEFHKKIVYARDGLRWRAEQYYTGAPSGFDKAEMESLKISDGRTLYTRDCASGESRSVALPSDILPENEAGIPSVDAVIRAVEKFPEHSDASKTDEDAGIADTILRLVRTENGNIYYIGFRYADIDLTEEYYVSLEHRMIIFANSTQNGKNVYSYEVLQFSTNGKDYARDELYSISKSAEQ